MKASNSSKSLAIRKHFKSFQNLPVIVGFYTHRTVRDRVIAKAIAGKTKTQIAEEEGLSRPTIRKILSHPDPETSEFIEQVRRRFISISKNAVETLVKKMLDEKNADISVDIATMILVANGILPREFMLLCFQQKQARSSRRSSRATRV